MGQSQQNKLVGVAILLCAGESTRTWGVMPQIGPYHHKAELAYDGIPLIIERIAQWVRAGVPDIVIVGSNDQALKNLLNLCSIEQLDKRSAMCAQKGDHAYVKSLNKLKDDLSKAKIVTAIQPEARGPGHAVECAMNELKQQGADLSQMSCAIDFMDDDWEQISSDDPEARVQAVETYRNHPDKIVVAAIRISIEQAKRYGCAKLDADGHILNTKEKPSQKEVKTEGFIGKDGKICALMGIHIFPPKVMQMIPLTPALTIGGKSEKFLNTTMRDAFTKGIPGIAYHPAGIYTDAGTNEGWQQGLIIKDLIRNPERFSCLNQDPRLKQLLLNASKA
jgi:UTP-glucose-1-phosphate uridylyltransferase